jgi:hypothetical protein
MTVVDGLSLHSSGIDTRGDNHARGHLAITGAPSGSGDASKSRAAEPSIDQLIGAELQALDPTLDNLVTRRFGIGATGYGSPVSTYHNLLYRKTTDGVEPLVCESDPRSAYDEIFPGGPPDTGPVDLVAARQNDVLALAESRYAALAPRLSTEDRRRLEEHRDLLSQLRGRIDGMRGATCSPGTRMTPRAGVDAAGAYTHMLEAYGLLAAAALSCNLSRVVVMQLDPVPLSMFGGSGDFHDTYAHASGPAQNRTTEGVRGTVEAEKIYANQVAQLADLFDSIPEGDGTLLDNTAIVWMHELAHGGHGFDLWPVVTIGGGAKGLRTGRYLKYALDEKGAYGYDELYESNGYVDSDGNYVQNPGGPSQNHFLVSLCRFMGIDRDYVGTRRITGRNHNKNYFYDIDVTGPLPGLVV